MKLIIDISEHIYASSKVLADIDGSPILKAIKNGIVLPEQHGRLVDVNLLCEDLIKRWDIADAAKEEMIKSIMAEIVTPIIVSQPTILEGTVKE